VAADSGIRKVSSGAVWESIVGYSRAVAAGDYVFVTGCTSIDGAEFVHEADAFAQTAQAIANVRSALEKLGVSLADVVRTRIYVTDISRWEEYGRAHAEAFVATMPATSMIEVSALIDPRMLVEVEAVAYKPGVGVGPGAAGR
jgi:enamine deaminase RidA (YjgF/YER057c/UK114 family)